MASINSVWVDDRYDDPDKVVSGNFRGLLVGVEEELQKAIENERTGDFSRVDAGGNEDVSFLEPSIKAISYVRGRPSDVTGNTLLIGSSTLRALELVVIVSKVILRPSFENAKVLFLKYKSGMAVFD